MQHPSPVETLEPRRLMASVGPVVAQHFIGPQEAVTAVVLTFDVLLDPTTAQNPAAYKLVRKTEDDDDGGFGGSGGDGGTDVNRVSVETANLRLGVHLRGPGPGDTASLPYFTVADLPATLQRVRELGGSVIHPGDHWAVCRDSEGSPFALAAAPASAE